MATLQDLVELLGSDQRELAAFIQDGDGWIAEHAPGLRDAERREIRNVHRDVMTLIEVRCREHFDQSAEPRNAHPMPN